MPIVKIVLRREKPCDVIVVRVTEIRIKSQMGYTTAKKASVLL